jgi:thiamine-phosphate pyrophosphorylase
VRGLYAIADIDFLAQHGVPPLAFVDAVLTARPAALQLRAKSLGARDTLALLRAIQARSAPLRVPVFCNDRPDLAVLSGCAGVHLGQTDLRISDVRRLAPELAVGLSTHRLEELDAALAGNPAYIAFGPVFATASKADAEPIVGLPALAEAGRRCRARGVPLVAIGGLSLERAYLVAESADAGAFISALLPESGLPGVGELASRLQRALGGGSTPGSTAVASEQ